MRKLTNSLLAGQVLALLAAESVFLMNPELPHTWLNVVSVAFTFGLTYGLAAGAAYLLLLMVVEATTGRRLGPAWVSYRVLTWLLALTFTFGAALYWHNVVTLRVFVAPDTLRALALCATAVTAAAAVLLTVGLFHFSFGRRGVIASYVLSTFTVLLALALPLFLRPSPERERSVPRLPIEDSPAPRRLTLIGLEGASMAYVMPAVAEGKLPNLARLIEGGASGSLRTLYPNESLAVWTSVATGKLPRQHGVKGFYRYRFPLSRSAVSVQPRGIDFSGLDRLGFLTRTAVSATARRTQPFWTILSRFGLRVGLVRLWGTYPADPVEGFVVSEYFHRQWWEGFDPALPELTHPEELFEPLGKHVILPEQVDSQMLAQFVDDSVPLRDRFPWQAELRRALAEDGTYHAVGRALLTEREPDVFAIYYFGLDAIGHYFTRYHQPEAFGDVSDAEIRKYGRTVEAYYRYLDAAVGEFVDRRAPEETILVVSGHGMEPLTLGRRVLAPFIGDPFVSGYHERSPDGLLIVHGPPIAPGVMIQGASVLDITPTLLYLMGLPLGQDMDGSLLTEIFESDVLRNQPVTYISSYHDFLIEPRGPAEEVEAASPLDGVPELTPRRE